MFQVSSPILIRSVKDKGEVHEFWDKAKKVLVPYYGNSSWTSHSVLKMQFDLCAISTSYNAVIKDLKKFAFSNTVSIQKMLDPCLETEGDDKSVAPESAKAFSQYLTKKNLGLPLVKTISREMFSSDRWSGNQYLKIKRVTVLGNARYYLKVINPLECAYIFTKSGKQRYMLISPEFKNDVVESKGRVIPVSTMKGDLVFTKPKNGVEETILHIGNYIDGSVWYGRPEIQAVTPWMFVEFKQGDKMCKVACTDIISKGAWAVEADPPNTEKTTENKDDSFKTYVKDIKSLSTMQGEAYQAAAMIILEYYNGGKPPEWIEMKTNTDVKGTEFSLSQARSEIYSSLGWFPELTGKTQTKGGLGSDTLMNLYITANEGTIKPIQDDYEGIWAYIYAQVMKHDGITGFEGYTVKFKDKISSLVDSLKGTRIGNSVTNRIDENAEGDD